jgi:ABC-type multidrug transport system permease subunit
MAELLRYSPYPEPIQLLITLVPLFFFAVAIAQYFWLGLRNQTDNQFRQRNFATTWGMLLLIVGEIGGVGAIVWGFISTQLLATPL